MARCEFCGSQVDLKDLLWHEAYHDQERLLWKQAQRWMDSTSEGLVLLHELIHDLEARVL